MQRSKEVSRELHSHRPLDLLQDMSYCPAVSRVAIGGGSTVKLLDTGAEYGEVHGTTLELPPGHSVERVGWGQDGQVCVRVLVLGLRLLGLQPSGMPRL
jgi:hypothetical protein